MMKIIRQMQQIQHRQQPRQKQQHLRNPQLEPSRGWCLL